jgi:serine/threonine protein kinase
MNESLLPKASSYAEPRNIEITGTLGSGKDGIVLLAKRKAEPAKVALKVFRYEELFLREKTTYQRLQECNVTKVLGLTCRS